MSGARVSAVALAVDGFDVVAGSVVEIAEGIESIRRAQAWFETARMRFLAELSRRAVADASVFPEAMLATSGTTSAAQNSRDVKRAATLVAVPGLAVRLGDGDCSTEHVDAVTVAAARLEPEHRAVLLADPTVAQLAGSCTPEEFRRQLARLGNRIHTDDGIARLQRQRRANMLRSWTDPVTGMVHYKVELDPETGARLDGRIHHQVEALFHTAVPDDCPTGDSKQGYLRAMALVSLTERGTTTSAGSGAGGVVEMIVVVDADTLRDGLHDRSRVDTGGDYEIPVESLRRIACEATIIPAVLDSNGVTVNIGRGARLANRAQRRALRAMYPTCAVPGCRVAYERCEPHHIDYWRHGGRTDLANLLPLCNKHHHLAHEGGWTLHLHPTTRVLTITLPDGTLHTTGPPTTRAG